MSATAAATTPTSRPLAQFPGYRTLRCLGRGTYGFVYLAQNEATGQDCAIKVMGEDVITKQFAGGKRGLLPTRDSIREISLLHHLQPHPNIVAIHHIGKVLMDDSERLFYVMNSAPMDLQQLLDISHKSKTCLSLQRAARIFASILIGLDHLRAHDVVHRDLKPGNLLVYPDEGDRIAICDFGMATYGPIPSTFPEAVAVTRVEPDFFDRPEMSGGLGTLWYRPPESLFGCKTHGFGFDMWSVGCIAAQLFSGQDLFACADEKGLYFKMCELLGRPHVGVWPSMPQTHPYIHHTASVQFPESITGELVGPNILYNNEENYHQDLWDALDDLLGRMLCYDPDKRITPAHALQHRFFALVFEAQGVYFPVVSQLSSSSSSSSSSCVATSAKELTRLDSVALVQSQPDETTTVRTSLAMWARELEITYLYSKVHSFGEPMLVACFARQLLDIAHTLDVLNETPPRHITLACLYIASCMYGATIACWSASQSVRVDEHASLNQAVVHIILATNGKIITQLQFHQVCRFWRASLRKSFGTRHTKLTSGLFEYFKTVFAHWDRSPASADPGSYDVQFQLLVSACLPTEESSLVRQSLFFSKFGQVPSTSVDNWSTCVHLPWSSPQIQTIPAVKAITSIEEPASIVPAVALPYAVSVRKRKAQATQAHTTVDEPNSKRACNNIA